MDTLREPCRLTQPTGVQLVTVQSPMLNNGKSVIGLDIAVITPAGRPDAALAIAGSRAGALGIIDLQFATGAALAAGVLDRLAEHGRGRRGVLVDAGTDLLGEVLRMTAPLDVVALSGCTDERLADAVAAVRAHGPLSFVVASSLEAARAAEAAGADAIIAKGYEAGGWVGDDGAFVLLQQCVAALRTPVWVHGGVGLHTAAACLVAGAAGAVLDGQLLLARESPLDAAARVRVAGMDGSETACLGPGGAPRLRVYSRPGAPGADALRRAEARRAPGVRPRARVDWADGDGTRGRPGRRLRRRARAPLRHRRRHRRGRAGGGRGAVRDRSRRRSRSREGAPLASSHGTRYPIVQGPMTRVSDRAEFARCGGGGGAACRCSPWP